MPAAQTEAQIERQRRMRELIEAARSKYSGMLPPEPAVMPGVNPNYLRLPEPGLRTWSVGDRPDREQRLRAALVPTMGPEVTDAIRARLGQADTDPPPAALMRWPYLESKFNRLDPRSASGEIDTEPPPMSNEELFKRRPDLAPGFQPKEIPEDVKKAVESGLKPGDTELAGDDERIRRLEALRQIAEGAGGFWATSGAQIRSGMKPWHGSSGPYVAENLRREIAKEEDLLTPEESQQVGQYFGVDVRPGQRLSRDFFGSIAPAIVQRQRADTASSQIDQKALADVKKQFEMRPTVKKARMVISTLPEIRTLLQQRTSTADRAVTTRLPRMNGEVGNMSTFDVKRFDERMGIINNIKDSLSKAVHGTLSESHRNELLKMLDALEKVVNQGLIDEAASDARSWTRVYPNLNEQAVAEIIAGVGPRTYKIEQTEIDKTTGQPTVHVYDNITEEEIDRLRAAGENFRILDQ